MLVYKFGGGVLPGPDGIERMLRILRGKIADPATRKIIVVVSALGKMTNAFEYLWRCWIGKKDATHAFSVIKDFHYGVTATILGEEKAFTILHPLFEKIEGIISGPVPGNEKMAYDQLVCYGELLSSRIISEYFTKNGLRHRLVDAGDLIITDSNYRDAKPDWPATDERVRLKLGNGEKDGLFLTQGFISRSIDGMPTTLGREGSDFSAAIIASVLRANELIIWKDVPGIMTSDPDIFPDSQKMDSVSYIEAIELSYFGAKVLHPNTIKPLHNRNIPLTVKSIYNPGDSGTVVKTDPLIEDERPVIIIKPNQVLVSILPRDLSFIMEDRLSSLFAYLSENNIKSNLFQHSAVSISICIDYYEILVNKMVSDLIADYRILYNAGLDLLTIRHYTGEVIDRYTAGRKIYVRQQSRRTARFVMR